MRRSRLFLHRGINMELCANCGHENRKEQITCEKCGYLLDDSHRAEQEMERQRLKKLHELMLETY